MRVFFLRIPTIRFRELFISTIYEVTYSAGLFDKIAFNLLIFKMADIFLIKIANYKNHELYSSQQKLLFQSLYV